ncbi:MAG: hypothetical protein ABWY51_10665 [Gaiellaceae bacterium]|jgi:hypothetical protein
MPAYVWIALGIFVVCLVAGTVWAVVNGLRAWRRGRPALRRMNDASALLNGRSTDLERRLALLAPKTSRLQRDVARLQRSIARARVLFGAVGEVKTVYRLARFFTP